MEATTRRPILQLSKTPSTELAISVADAKRHLHIEAIETYYDIEIEGYIRAAQEYIEDWTNSTLFNTSVTAIWNRFPHASEPLSIPAWPIVSITSIAYRDSDGNAQTITPATGVQSSLYSKPAIILPLPDTEWPVTQLDRLDAVTVVFVAGYGTTESTVPYRVKQAMRLLVGHWFKNREAVLTGSISKEIELAVHSLLNQIRVNEFTEFERQ